MKNMVYIIEETREDKTITNMKEEKVSKLSYNHSEALLRIILDKEGCKRTILTVILIPSDLSLED